MTKDSERARVLWKGCLIVLLAAAIVLIVTAYYGWQSLQDWNRYP